MDESALLDELRRGNNDAYKQLFIDRESPYYVEETIDPTMYTVYNSFTNIIKDDSKDLLNKFEKTVIVDKILNLV